METSPYFIAIIPDSKICAEVKSFKEYAKEHFNSSRALRSPAHITLEAPFKWRSDQITLLSKKLRAFTKLQHPFAVELHNFNAFSPRVIFVDLLPNKLLTDFQGQLKQHLRKELNLISDRPDHPFKPHMTIAFKDLKKTTFETAWEHFSKIAYQRSFVVNQICLLRHNGKTWEGVAYFKMKEIPLL